jgi:hypothetical protein
MRRGVTIFILVTVVVLGFAVHSVWTLLGLLVATGREDAILRGEPKLGNKKRPAPVDSQDHSPDVHQRKHTGALEGPAAELSGPAP